LGSEGLSIIVQLFCTDIKKLTGIIPWSEKAYCRIPVLGLDEHQTDVFQGKRKTGFFIYSCKPLIHYCLIKAEIDIKSLIN
jgi:hypothetical protein